MARAEAILRSSWFLGAAVAVAAWNVVFKAPLPGNDGSWAVGLYMAADQGLRFGEELIFTYGPLGFLSPLNPSFGGVAIAAGVGSPQLAFFYSAAIHLLLCVSLVWALRRWLPVAPATLIAFVAVAGFPAIQRPQVLAAIWCLALLADPPTPMARPLVIYAGAALAAVESLVRLSSGPVILLMCGIALAATDGWRRDLPAFAATFLAAIAALWFAAGQGLGNVGDYVAGGFQIVSGYSQAMATAPAGAKYDLAILAGAAAVALLAAAAYATSSGQGRRVAAGVLIGIAAFAAFKEGIVREDEPHLAILFATTTALALAIPWQRASRAAALGLAAALAALAGVTATPALQAGDFNPVDNADTFGTQTHAAFSAERREHLSQAGALVIINFSQLSPDIAADLDGHTVHADPSGTAVIRAYDFDWHPLPVFQENSAYTTTLDEKNVEALESPNGPERVLRGLPEAVDPLSQGTIDNRNPAWNPPGVSVALLCRWRAVRTSAPWQLLRPGLDRCGAERPLGSVDAGYGDEVEVPAARRGEAVLVRIHGAEVAGLERIRAFLFRARPRLATVNGLTTYRLVPGTADDGLILTVPPRLDFEGPFALSARARTLELTGASGDLRFEFYGLPIRGSAG